MDHTMESTQINNQLEPNCLVSGNPVVKIVDLGMHPYADTFISTDQLGLSEPVLPLEVYLCPSSGQIQLGYITNDFERYNLYSYSYTSANSQFSRDHWDAYYQSIKERFQIVDKSVLEIGSNDGYLLDHFSHDNVVLGVDSSESMCQVASAKGVKTISAIFNTQLADTIKHEQGTFDFIIANNVFNHSNTPLDFAKGVYNLLSADGVFVFELPYWKDTFISKKFDQIYHEHVSYFTVKSSYHLLKSAQLEIFDVEEIDYHGGSIRVFARKSDNVVLSENIASAIQSEEDLGLFDPETYVGWQKDIQETRNAFLKQIYEIMLEHPDVPIIGVGAAAKANTFLNYYNLDSSILTYITDSSEYKQGKFTPLTRIPIVSDDIFATYEDVFALILSWNLSERLKQILLQINPHIKFIEMG